MILLGVLGVAMVSLFPGCYTPLQDNKWEATLDGMRPNSGETTRETRPTLSWNPVDGAVMYEVQISNTDVAAAVPVSVTTPSYTPTKVLTNGHTHYWRVRAINADGKMTDWCPTSNLLISWGTIR